MRVFLPAKGGGTVLQGLLGLLVGFSPIVLFMCLFSWIRRSAKKQEPRQDGSALEFFVDPGMRFLLGLVMVLLASFSALVAVTAISRGEGLYAVLIPLGVLVAMFSTKPTPVILDQAGIRQHRWLRADREIAWSDVASMKRGPRTGATYVRGRSGGGLIRFSPLLVGQSRFEREVRVHASPAIADE